MLRPVGFVLTGMLVGVNFVSLLIRLAAGMATLIDWLALMVGLAVVAFFLRQYRSEGWHRGD